MELAKNADNELEVFDQGDAPEEEQMEEGEAKINNALTMEGVKNSLNLVGWAIFNLAAVYFLEYMCTTSFAERANPKPSAEEEKTQDFWHKEAFILLSLCYQIGVFISRSSFNFFQFNRVGILTAI